MYGRYGTDTLNLVLLIAGLVIALIAQLTRFCFPDNFRLTVFSRLFLDEFSRNRRLFFSSFLL